jgi:cell filamentation protein
VTDYFTDDDSQLQNKLGITDSEQLVAKEQEIVAQKSALILAENPPNQLNINYLKYIHRVLFEDIYDFAGQFRTVDIMKPDSNVPFAHAEFIQPEIQRIFRELTNQYYLRGLPDESFIDKIAELAADLNALHPFREGNGRTIRLFLIILADQAGFLLDYSQVSSTELITADKLAFEGNISSLIKVYKLITENINRN